MAIAITTRPFGRTAWKVFKDGTQIGTIQKTAHECHCANFGKWKYQAYNLRNQQVGIAQFSLANAKHRFK